MRKMGAKIAVLLALIIGSEFVLGQDNNGIFDGEYSFVSMLIILLFCLGGVYLCLYFTCCHEYLCMPKENMGCCGDLRNEELTPNSKDNGKVKTDSSLLVAV